MTTWASVVVIELAHSVFPGDDDVWVIIIGSKNISEGRGMDIMTKLRGEVLLKALS